MIKETVSSDNLSGYAGIIPDEYLIGFDEGSVNATGVVFGDSPSGAVVWHEDKSNIVLDSLYVLPEYRRLGVGSKLLEDFAGKHLKFSYIAYGDRVTLEPFFIASDIVFDRSDCGLGSFTLAEAKAALEKKKVTKSGAVGIMGNELTFRDKAVVGKWLLDNYGVDVSPYLTEKPLSAFIIDGDSVRSAVLLRIGESDALDLDFVYTTPGNEIAFAGLLNRVFAENEKLFDKDIRIEMLLATDEGKKLYEGLFGEAKIKVPMIVAE